MALPAALPARSGIVLADVLPGDRVRDAVLVAGGAALTGLAAQVAIPLPGTPVPVTGQTFAVLLVGAALGTRRGLASIGAYLVLGLVGLPWFAQGGGGWQTTQSATFGYLLGMLVAAGAVGRLARAGLDRTPLRTVLTMGVGTVIIYVFGVGWLAARLGVSVARATDLGLVPFLWGDAAKVVLAAALLPAAWRLSRRGR